MADPLTEAILTEVARAGDRGVAMGALVDTFLEDGATEETVEMAVWSLLAARRIVPSGFICRLVRKRNTAGQPLRLRTYELMLARPETDGSQLDLRLDPEQGSR